MGQTSHPFSKYAKEIERRSRICDEIRPATREWEEAGMVPVAKPIDSAPEYNVHAGLVPRPRERYYPETSKIGRVLRWHEKPWEIQYDRGVPHQHLSVKEAKAPPSPKCRLREGEVQQRTEPDWDAYVLDIDHYAAHFAFSPEGQAEVARRFREDTERHAAMQAAIEVKRVVDERERARVAKEKSEKELKAETAAKPKEHRIPQQGERVEYLVLRNAHDCGQPWPTDEEIREILGKDPCASGTEYGTHFAIRFTHK